MILKFRHHDVKKINIAPYITKCYTIIAYYDRHDIIFIFYFIENN